MCVFLHTIRTCVQEIWCTNDIERPNRGQPSNQKAGAWRAHAHCPYWAYNSYLAHQAHCLIALIIPIWLIRPIALLPLSSLSGSSGLLGLLGLISLMSPIGLIGRFAEGGKRPQQKASNNNAKGRLPHCGRRPFAKSLTVKLLAMLLLAAIARARDAMRIAARPPDDGRQASPTRPAQAGCQAYHSRRRG